MSAPFSDSDMTRAEALEMLDFARIAHADFAAFIDPSSPIYPTLKASADILADGVRALEIYVEQTRGGE